MDPLHTNTILLIISIFFLFTYSRLIPEKTGRELNVNYDINLEPRMDNCSEPILISNMKSIRFKKLDRRTLSVATLFELYKQVEEPVKVVISLEVLQQGSYVFYLEVPNDNICEELASDDEDEGIFATYAHRFKVYSCPIKKGIYDTANFTVNLDQIDLGPQHVGRYRIKVTMSGMVEGEMQDFYCQVYFTRVERERSRS